MSSCLRPSCFSSSRHRMSFIVCSPFVALTRAHQKAPTKMAAAGSPAAAIHSKALLLVLARVLSGQCGDEGLLRDLDPADGLHPLLAFLLLLQQLALPRNVTAV